MEVTENQWYAMLDTARLRGRGIYSFLAPYKIILCESTRKDAINRSRSFSFFMISGVYHHMIAFRMAIRDCKRGEHSSQAPLSLHAIRTNGLHSLHRLIASSLIPRHIYRNFGIILAAHIIRLHPQAPPPKPPPLPESPYPVTSASSRYASLC